MFCYLTVRQVKLQKLIYEFDEVMSITKERLRFLSV